MMDSESHSKTSQSIHSNTKNKCHWLPCSIDYDGLAPVHIYFQPESTTKTTNNSKTIQAVSFRGRGLLSSSIDNNENNTLPKGIIGSVMAIDESINNSCDDGDDSLNQLVMKETFDSIYEWEHECHEHNLIKNEVLLGKEGMDCDGNVGGDCNYYDTQGEGSIAKSFGIMEILQSLHSPIAVED